MISICDTIVKFKLGGIYITKKERPEDFMLQLKDQWTELKVSQKPIPARKHLGGYKPYVNCDPIACNWEVSPVCYPTPVNLMQNERFGMSFYFLSFQYPGSLLSCITAIINISSTVVW
jgi:hypothetical protein